MENKYIELHKKNFTSDKPISLFFSPGRVNLIGEHIDYNGGFVLPLALTIGNHGTFQMRDDQEIHLFSDSFPIGGIFKTSLSSLQFEKNHDWANYVKGVIYFLKEKGYTINQGFNICIFSSLPSGAGLSSSASIEALIAVMMNEMFHLNINREVLSLITQEVENKYMDVNCGIMDQFVILNGEDHCALMLNTATLQFEVVPLVLEDTDIVIINSKKKRGLVDSAYNQRRNECEQALAFFQKHLNVRELCEISVTDFEKFSPLLENNTLVKRAKHCVYEQDRVIKTAEALKRNDLNEVGHYLIASHESLRDDYEVSVQEVDLLVELAIKYNAIGSRMTGAGFGGCTVNLVRKVDTNALIENVKREYNKLTGLSAEFYTAKASNKTSLLKEVSYE